MRLSRTNHPHGFDTTSDPAAELSPPRAEPRKRIYGTPETLQPPGQQTGAQNADEMAAGEIEGRMVAPIWQSNFVIGPNVRFTRTPESAFPRRTRPKAVEHEMVEVNPAPPQPVVQLVEPPQAAEPTVIEHEALPLTDEPAQPERIDEVAVAATTQIGDQGLTIGRSAALLAGLPKSVPGYSIDRMCAGAMTAVTTTASGIGLGNLAAPMIWSADGRYLALTRHVQRYEEDLLVWLKARFGVEVVAKEHRAQVEAAPAVRF